MHFVAGRIRITRFVLKLFLQSNLLWCRMTGFIGCSFLDVPPLLLQTPQDAISSGTTVVLPGNRRAFLFGQRGQDLPVLLVYVCDLSRDGSLPQGPQPLRYELDYGCHDMLPLLVDG